MLEVPRSTIYYQNKLKLPDLELEGKIDEIFKKSRKNYGTRKIREELRKDGYTISRRKIGKVMKKYHLKRSLSQKGTPLDNAVIESTNHILKTEFIYQHQFRSLEELNLLLFDYIHWYNYERIHGTLNYQTPIEYRRKHGELAGANVVCHTSLKNCTKKC